ncbi:MAG: class I SAM-dependent methyltransferase [Candidatus Helarchaeota archaeon]
MTNFVIKNVKFKILSIFRNLGYEIRKIDLENRFTTKDSEKLAKDYKKFKCVKLHFGCGPRILKGWINIDLKFVPYQKFMKYYTNKYYPKEIRGNRSDFYVLDITKENLPLPNNSVDVIFHEDFIEHLNQRDQIIFLAETFRVLKSGGIHRVNTPNLLVSMKEKSNFSEGRNGVHVKEWNKHLHFNILTPSMLEEFAKMIGYSKIVFNSKNNSSSSLVPLEYRPDVRDRPEIGNIFADLIK